MANIINHLDPFNGVYGLPPSTWISDEMIINSMPVLEITPCIPHFQSGLNLFRVEDASKQYLKILNNHGYATEVPIKCAFLADNFPTDSFTNEYGETFLQKFTDVASQGMSQLAQMTGATTGTGGMKNIGSAFSDLGEEMGGMSGGALSGVGGAAQATGEGIEKLIRKMRSGKASGVSRMLGGGAELINKMVAGHRVDFPQVWRNSGFTPSYTATIRLYNPNPASKISTEKYIVGPLAVLLCLAVPRSDDGKTYNWPFFHKVKATGIYNLSPAVITNITVIKGGDQQQISYNQNLGIVDVRIDFASLYGSMLVEEGKNTFTNRPTVRSYLSSLKEDDPALSTRRNKLNQSIGSRAGIDLITTRISQLSPEDLVQLVKNAAAKQRQAPKVSTTSEENRVSTTVWNTENNLTTGSDIGFYSHRSDKQH
jgi:hypothetical protein